MDLMNLVLAKKLSESGGSGSVAQVQADWNQNDPNGAGYVKNRTHYDNSEYIIQSSIFSEDTEVQGVYSSDVVKTNGIRISSGIITINGNNYNFKAYDSSFSNISDVPEEYLINVGTASVVVRCNYWGFWGLRVYSTEYFDKVDVTAIIEKIVQLDEKYIPSDFLRLSKIEQFSSALQSDWTEDDQTKNSYIKNRPFGISYNISSSYITETFVPPVEMNGKAIVLNKNLNWALRLCYDREDTKYWINGVAATVAQVINEGAYENFQINLFDGKGPTYQLDAWGDGITVSFTQRTLSPTELNITIRSVEPVIKTLPEYYIPDTIARKADLKNYVMQSDWDQDDETAIDFIKNKPNEDDALKIINEMGFVEPIASEDGSIYTDENNNIYTLI